MNSPEAFQSAYEGPEEVPTKTSFLRSVDEAVQVGTTLGRSWFRGQPKTFGTLNPRIFRREFRDSIVDSFRPGLEAEVVEAFKSDAPAVASVPLPSDDDTLGWLYLMQHFGTPTRLLDWTESVLPALYFAVEADAREDGEIWALYGQSLNEAAGIGNQIPFLHHPAIHFLARDIFVRDEKRQDLAVEMKLHRAPDRPIAFVPRRNFPRMLVQTSVFTIHPKPTPGNTVPEILTDPRALVRYVIPADRKERIRRDLEALGISRRTLFPDFEGLAAHLTREMSVIAYSPPDPPEFGDVTE